ncbi:transcription elongation factor spt4 [Elasticomyces elasticus]|nr:transcription elongation factor spt4 [Elasticomyces elasticus]KAK4990788.1 transcription elongation factor spt4 [Elasticomyces elasticus]KAK4996428.1 transcription elongation factor spt4 [Elasticomyces elasticus]
MSFFVPPSQHRSLRACMVCSIVQPASKFQTQGCPNCEDVLQLAGRSDSVLECTSTVFEGMMTITEPAKSWVAKWQRLDGYVPGVYAVKVVGILPEDVISDVENAGIKYLPRDGTATEDIQ